MITRIKVKFHILMTVTIFCNVTSHAGTAVGNGGDIFSQYIESSRSALKESIRSLQANPNDLSSLCGTETDLSSAQQDECRNFLKQTMNDILLINQKDPAPEFLLRSDPLLVTGLDNQPMDVDARTNLGPAGDIEVNYDHARYYSPFQILTLITHESGHKVFFNQQYVQDNPPTATFTTGRKLLDSVGFALATYAQSKGIIGSDFKLLDHFSCTIASTNNTTVVGSGGFSLRTFRDPNNYDLYETGIGYIPSSFDVYTVEKGFSELHFKVLIHEEGGCEPTTSGQRWTELSLIREYPALSGPIKNDELLAQNHFNDWNPVCGKLEDSKPIILKFSDLEFTCQYTGSSGNSNQQ